MNRNLAYIAIFFLLIVNIYSLIISLYWQKNDVKTYVIHINSYQKCKPLGEIKNGNGQIILSKAY